MRRVTLFAITWRWYDRLVAFGDDEPYWVLELALGAVEQNNVPFDEALGQTVPYLVYKIEEYGTDLVEALEESVELRVAQEGIQAFHARKKG